VNKENCLICKRIALIKTNKNPYFIKELETGYVVLGDYQLFRGYTLFIYKEHKSELHQLSTQKRQKFLAEMAVVAEAVYRAVKPHKMNYELLGNTEEHMHWHLFPRHANDPMPNRAVWCIDPKIRNAKNAKPDGDTVNKLKKSILTELKKLTYQKPVW